MMITTAKETITISSWNWRLIHFISCLLQSFKSFTNRRKFTCNYGIPPFEYSSETSIKGKRRVSHFTDKKMKSILHLSTLSAIKHDAEIRTYYERKTGKKYFYVSLFHDLNYIETLGFDIVILYRYNTFQVTVIKSCSVAGQMYRQERPRSSICNE